jgi:hypothetical protein
MNLPPGFGAVNLPLPRATKEAFACLDLIFSQLPFMKGGLGGISAIAFPYPNLLSKF